MPQKTTTTVPVAKVHGPFKVWTCDAAPSLQEGTAHLKLRRSIKHRQEPQNTASLTAAAAAAIVKIALETAAHIRNSLLYLKDLRVPNAMGPHSHQDMVLCLPGSSQCLPQVSEMKVTSSPMPDKCPKERGGLHINFTYPSLISTHWSGARGWRVGSGGGGGPFTD